MINLMQHAKKYYEDKERERARYENRPTEQLIPSPESSTEITRTYGPTVGIIQPNQAINEAPIGHLTNVTQYNQEEINEQQTTPAGNEDKINVYAALLSMVLYICSISIIIYGCLHLHDCPAQKMITISYIVMGCLMLFSRLLSSPEECRSIFKIGSSSHILPQDLCRACVNFIVQIATMCFFFALCYWIFHLNPDTKEGSPNFCEKELYKNTYYGCIIALSFLGIGFFLTCCGVCIIACKSV